MYYFIWADTDHHFTRRKIITFASFVIHLFGLFCAEVETEATSFASHPLFAQKKKNSSNPLFFALVKTIIHLKLFISLLSCRPRIEDRPNSLR